MTLESYLDGNHWGQNCFSITGAMREVEGITTQAISDIKKAGDEYFGDAWHRFSTGVDFFSDSVKAIGDLDPLPEARTLRLREKVGSNLKGEDLYDRIAESMFEIIFWASTIDGPPDKAWSIQHNTVWTSFFERFDDKPVWKYIQFKLRRLLYDEICDLESLPNYKAAGILGICLNVMGLTIGKRSGYGREYMALKIAILAWTQRNYLSLRQVNADIADRCLVGSITFDAENSRLVKTYAKGLKPEPSREYLSLNLPSNAE